VTRDELAARVAQARKNGLVLKLPQSSDGYPAGWYRKTGPAQAAGPYPTATDALKAAEIEANSVWGGKIVRAAESTRPA